MKALTTILVRRLDEVALHRRLALAIMLAAAAVPVTPAKTPPPPPPLVQPNAPPPTAQQMLRRHMDVTSGSAGTQSFDADSVVGGISVTELLEKLGVPLTGDGRALRSKLDDIILNKDARRSLRCVFVPQQAEAAGGTVEQQLDVGVLSLYCP